MLGENVPIVMGNLNSSIFALVDGKLVNFAVPYPMGFFANEGREITEAMPAKSKLGAHRTFMTSCSSRLPLELRWAGMRRTQCSGYSATICDWPHIPNGVGFA